jgi:hypothetical protein
LDLIKLFFQPAVGFQPELQPGAVYADRAVVHLKYLTDLFLTEVAVAVAQFHGHLPHPFGPGFAV